MFHKTNRDRPFLQIGVMFLENGFQVGFRPQQSDSDMIDRHATGLSNLAIALFQVIPPINQILLAFRQLGQRVLQNSAAIQFNALFKATSLNTLPIRNLTRTVAPLPSIIARQVSHDRSQICAKASCSTPWAQPSIVVLPNVQQESLIEFFHIFMTKALLTTQNRNNESTIRPHKLIQRARVSRQQPCNKTRIIFQLHRRN